MGSTADIITSGPSVIGATSAATAATYYPFARFVAVPLVLIVSDPAQIWHAGERFSTIADHLRTASSEMTAAVTRHADSDHWNEHGKKAFLNNRLKPYQQALAKSAQMFDDVRLTLFGCATSYTFAGIASAAIGAEVLASAASVLVSAAVAPLEAGAISMANYRLLQAWQVVKKIMGFLAALDSAVVGAFGKITNLLITGGAIGTEALTGVYYPNSSAIHSFKDTEVTVRWPMQQKAGAALPEGYHAPSAAQSHALKMIAPASIKALGEDLDKGAAQTIGQAYDQARGNDVGAPGFGLIGIRTAHAYSEMRNHAADQLAACRDAPGTWLPGLRTTADNWIFAEQKNDRSTRFGWTDWLDRLTHHVH
jgi:hypothetical protein